MMAATLSTPASGDDIVYGQDGQDTLKGGIGNDWLIGGGGDGSNKDLLDGGTGTNKLYQGDNNSSQLRDLVKAALPTWSTAFHRQRLADRAVQRQHAASPRAIRTAPTSTRWPLSLRRGAPTT